MIEIREDDMYAAIFYECRDYTVPNASWIEPVAQQLYAQMMGWA